MAAMALDRMYKMYLYKNLFSDARRFFKRTFRDVELDRDYWLHKVGLTSYSPAKNVFGGIAMLLLGGAAGAVIALALAPKSGPELRHEMKDKAMRMFERGAGAGEAHAQA